MSPPASEQPMLTAISSDVNDTGEPCVVLEITGFDSITDATAYAEMFLHGDGAVFEPFGGNVH